MELFPNVANTFLKKLREREYAEYIKANPISKEPDEIEIADRMWEKLALYA